MDAAMETAQLILRVKLLEGRIDALRSAIYEVMTYEKQNHEKLGEYLRKISTDAKEEEVQFVAELQKIRAEIRRDVYNDVLAMITELLGGEDGEGENHSEEQGDL